MSKNNDRNTTRHVSFTAEEDQLLRQRAEAVGLSVTAYIRQQALKGTVHYIDWDALRVHGEILKDISMGINLFIDNLSEIERSMLADDLVQLKNYLKTTLAIERDVYQFIVQDETEEA